MNWAAKILCVASSSMSLAMALNSQAQSACPQPAQSPLAHPDRRVTFSIRSPNVQTVELSAHFLKADQPFQADIKAVWSITVRPIEPSVSPYKFVVDGISIADSGNQNSFPNDRFKTSFVDVLDEQAVQPFGPGLTARRTLLLLFSEQIEQKTRFAGGGHTGMNARHYLAATLQLYFQ